MESSEYLIIGGGPSGTSAAEAIRSIDQDGTITIVDEQKERLYSKITLHKFIEGVLPKENMYLKDESWYVQNRIDLLGGKATDINSENKIVTLDNTQTISYEKLLFTGGGYPRKLGVENEAARGIYSLYSLHDAEMIAESLKAATNVVVVGGGFLTIDILETLARLGKKVTVVIRNERVLKEKIGPKGSKIIFDRLVGLGINFEFNASVERFEANEAVKGVVLSGSKTLPADLVIVAIGIVSNVELAKRVKAEVDRGIVVNDKQETSASGVFAAGDLCQVRDKATGESFVPGNWYYATISGRVAGINMAGGEASNEDMPIVAKNVAGLKLGFLGFIDEKYIASEFEKNGSYIQTYQKNGKLIGLSVIDSTHPIADFKKMIGKDFDESVIREMI